MEAVDIRGWALDEQFSPFPEGARDKYALIAPAHVSDNRIHASHRYLMKFSNPRYPVQFWSELIARAIGEISLVDVPECFYAEDDKTGAPGTLISWFYGEKVEQPLSVAPGVNSVDGDALPEIPTVIPQTHSLYVPGSSYMVRRIKDYDLKTGKQHNLREIALLITRMRQIGGVDYWEHWARTLTFDALIGNTDRHQDNWGVLWRTDESGTLYPRFAPAFDNGTALLHEIMESKLDQFRDPERTLRYVQRGRHHMRERVDDAKSAGHIDLLSNLAASRAELKDTILQVALIDRDRLAASLAEMAAFICAVPLTKVRADAIFKVVVERSKLIQEKISAV